MDTAPQFDGYSRVRLIVSDEMEYTAGTDTGLTLTLNNPFGTQAMCNDILAYILGYAYQPASASGAEIDPAAEIGDGVTIGTAYTGIYVKKADFGQLHTADIQAPTQKEIPHEYEYKSQSNREVNRRFANVSSQLKIQANEIAAKVEKVGGDAQSMGWSLQSDKWVVTANSETVFEITKNGARIRGTIEALSGSIGGLTLKDNALVSNNFSWWSKNSNGLYVGPNGIRLGQNFKVDSSGNLTASSGKFTGTVYAGSIKYGKDEGGYFSGAGITSNSILGGKIINGAITTSKCSDGINTSIGYANYSNDVFEGKKTAKFINASSMIFDGYAVGRGETDGIRYLTWLPITEKR